MTTLAYDSREANGANGGEFSMSDPLHEELARESDRIVNLILHGDVQWNDIEIEIEKMRLRVKKTDPIRVGTFEMIYPPRFRRIWGHWHETHDQTPDD